MLSLRSLVPTIVVLASSAQAQVEHVTGFSVRDLPLPKASKAWGGLDRLPEGDLDLFRVTSEWEESNVTWVNRLASTPWLKRGTDYNPSVVATKHVSGTSDYVFDITQLV